VVFFIRSTLDLSHQYSVSMLTGSARCVASFKSAVGATHSQRKDAANENAPVIDPVWTKERWNPIQRRPDARDDAADQDAPFHDPLWTRLRWSQVGGHPYRGKVAAWTVRRLKSLSGQESAELEPGVVRKETYSEILRRCLSCGLSHTVQFILRPVPRFFA